MSLAPRGQPKAGGAAGAHPHSSAQSSSSYGLGRHDTVPGYARLSRAEWRTQTARALGLPGASEPAFASEGSYPAVQGFRGHFALSSLMRSGEKDVRDLLADAKDLAERHVRALTALGQCPSVSMASDACLNEHISSLAGRLFTGRTPPSSVVPRSQALLSPVADTESRESRLSRAVTFLVASSASVHRTERPVKEAEGHGLAKAEDIAIRIARLAGMRAPDDLLTSAASAGRLATAAGRTEHFRRLAAEADHFASVAAFAQEWMSVPRALVSKKSKELLDGLPADVDGLARDGFLLYLRHVLQQHGGRIDAFLAAPVPSAALAVLGASAATGASSAQAHTPEARVGLATLPFVVAAHTKESGISAFELGKFVNESLLCAPIDPPPQLPADASAPIAGLTYREAMERKTAAPSCKGCHVRLAPPGFALHAFDSVGRRLPTDAAGKPWDTSGRLVFEGVDISFSHESAFLQKLAAAPRGRACVARRVFRYALGRFEAADDGVDRAAIAALETSALRPGATLTQLFETAVASEAFARVRLRGTR